MRLSTFLIVSLAMIGAACGSSRPSDADIVATIEAGVQAMVQARADIEATAEARVEEELAKVSSPFVVEPMLPVIREIDIERLIGAGGQQAQVLRAIDGDTIDVGFDNGAREVVRLLAVDTPETTGARSQRPSPPRSLMA